MKRLFTSFVLIALAISFFAQPPEKMSFQSVVRNSSGALVTNHVVGIKVSILQGSVTGTVVYSETYSPNPQTNANGLVTLEIGGGTPSVGTFSGINWASGPFYLKTETDPSGGSSYTITGTSQLLSVPYSLYSKKTGDLDDNSVTSPKIADGAVTNTKIINTAVSTDKLANSAVTAPKLASMGATAGQVLTYNGTAWQPQTYTSNPWLPSGSDIYFSTGKVGIGKIPGADVRQFQVLTGTSQAIAGVNNSASYATIYGQNLGAGPAADFRNRIRIVDGTQGGGKVLTSDADGYSSWQAPAESPWQKSGNHVYYSTGYVGIGFTNPLYNLDIREQTNHSLINLKAIINKDAIIYIDKGGVAQYAAINFRDQLATKFWIGLLNNDNMRISTHYSSLNGMEITSAGDANFTGMLNIHKGVASGQALLVNSKEAIWFDGTYFSWGFGGTWNYFKDAVGIDCQPGDGHLLAVNGVASKPGGGTWAAFSDIRLKDVHGHYTRSLKDIIQLQPVRFNYKDGNELKLPSEPEYVGFIAQDVKEIFPETVNETPGGYLEFDMHAVNVAMVNAIKELNQRIEAQQREIDELKAFVSSLIEK